MSVLRASLCSTPFGITDFRTNLAHVRAELRDVLNAFRHHRFPHSAMAGDDIDPERVLNAFRHHRFPHPFSCIKRTRRRSCAQRLSASQISALDLDVQGLAQHEVLNAFRHHRFPHRVAPPAKASCSSVLNAFRHHRFPHTWHADRSPDSVRCSTPFGITDFRTRELDKLSDWRIGVLNAFRHHRFPHVDGDGYLKADILCSTPFGITDFRTSPYSFGPLDLTECSTPFGITDFRTIRQLCLFSMLWRAQRLSASQISARFRLDPGPNPNTVCSTPFGITDFRTVPNGQGPLEVLLCSTPFGITDFRTRFAYPSGSSYPSCSTPFGITDFRTVLRACISKLRTRVLNAFRHHRFPHFPARNGNHALDVLNAFRHHRFPHSSRVTVCF